jgi:hypothetical protein
MARVLREPFRRVGRGMQHVQDGRATIDEWVRVVQEKRDAGWPPPEET